MSCVHAWWVIACIRAYLTHKHIWHTSNDARAHEYWKCEYPSGGVPCCLGQIPDWVSLRTQHMFDLFVHGLSWSILVSMWLLMVCPPALRLFAYVSPSLFDLLVRCMASLSQDFCSDGLPCALASASSWPICALHWWHPVLLMCLLMHRPLCVWVVCS